MSNGHADPKSIRIPDGHDPADVFERHRAELERSRRAATLLYGGLFVLALAAAVYISNFYPDKLAAGVPKIGDYIYDILPVLDPALLFAGTKTEGSIAYWYFNLPKYLQLLAETINMALFATIFGAFGGFVLCFPASRNLAPNGWVYFLCRRYMEFCRGVPEVIFAIAFVWAFGIGPLAGIVAIAIHSAGALGKLFSEVNENVDTKPMEGIRASGGSWFDEIRHGVVPQVLPNFVSYTLLRFEINIRASSIIGFVGGGGVGQELYYVINFNFYEEVSALVLLIVATVTCVDLISERVRHRFIGRENLVRENLA
ncbi:MULTISPECIES: phosphonate ABC transporter, permease protein PhnE [Thalassobaculum]|uniref:Phosphonate transport system permease protein n=1 Tax=Thalassobaculum litoreum DSM 18839 TaxID=1123362 RepID=A0A8G2ETY1_9PROT|nr:MULTISPECIES: phosphonate ABC transporter, permease protein PhnE [Thalassobaculum]SDF07371.1 phosphonate transport system permease protein [Thalassobaculum litoreum DSM 18839]